MSDRCGSFNKQVLERAFRLVAPNVMKDDSVANNAFAEVAEGRPPIKVLQDLRVLEHAFRMVEAPPEPAPAPAPTPVVTLSSLSPFLAHDPERDQRIRAHVRKLVDEYVAKQQANH